MRFIVLIFLVLNLGACGADSPSNLKNDFSYSLDKNWKDRLSPKFIGRYDYEKGENVFAFKVKKGESKSKHLKKMREQNRQMKFGEYKVSLDLDEELTFGVIEYRGSVVNKNIFHVSRNPNNPENLIIKTDKNQTREEISYLDSGKNRGLTRAGFLIGVENIGNGKVKVYKIKLGN